MKAPLKRIVFGALILASLLATGRAQSGGTFDLIWSTIDGGGGGTSGGGFSINGTIGQPDAGTPVTGGMFTLTGGFWAGASPEPLPRLSIRLLPGTPNRVVLWWPNSSSGFFHLQRLCDGVGWTDVSETPVVVAPNKEVTLLATHQFCMFRLKGRFTP